MLDVRQLNVRYGKSHVVFDLDLQVQDGEVVSLLGRNGAGKTTTLLGIAGLLPGASGDVHLGDLEIGRWPGYRRVRAGLGYVPAGARCFPSLTVSENLDIAAARGAWNQSTVFALFPALAGLRGNLAGGLSGGERQMLSVGRALMGNPRILLLDEPTEGLAPVVVQGIVGLLAELKSRGVGILIAEQNHQVALRVADRAAFIEKGRIVEQLAAAEARRSDVVHRILGV